jgi:hypothetical protein
MRKTLPKLALRKETLRSLADIELVHVAKVRGGDALLAGELTHENGCPLAKALKG